MSARRFTQLDVFTDTPTMGNGLAVVHDAQGLSEEEMAAFARWTQLAETTFLFPPSDPGADYRVRIFTPQRELPFAGHPTLGSCQAWLLAGGRPRSGEIVQQCGVGLVRIRRDGERLAFAAPARLRSGPLDEDLLARIASGLRIARSEILDHEWVDNGPGWCGVRLKSAQAVLALEPHWPVLNELKLGVVGLYPQGHEVDVEVRALIGAGAGIEDPVTGSLNASLAQWLISKGTLPDRYRSAQGTCIGRRGRIFLERLGQDIWVGGQVAECIRGEIRLGSGR